VQHFSQVVRHDLAERQLLMAGLPGGPATGLDEQDDQFLHGCQWRFGTTGGTGGSELTMAIVTIATP
jgi:hypothetical protein